MTSLTGLGVWIWELAKCEGGDPAAIAAKAKQSGVSWVAIKAGEERSNGQVTRARVEALRANGIECAAWWYSCPRTTAGEIVLLRDLVNNQGIRHLIQDAEMEWESIPGPTGARVAHDFRTEAKAYATQVRAAIGPDVFLADAPWARPKSHGSPFPYAEFGAITNARYPQFYWEVAAVGGVRFDDFLTQADQQWTALPSMTEVCPVGCTVDYKGVQHSPLSELTAFLERYAARTSTSLWSWQHLSAAEWALLAQRTLKKANEPIAKADNQPIYAAPDPSEGGTPTPRDIA